MAILPHITRSGLPDIDSAPSAMPGEPVSANLKAARERLNDGRIQQSAALGKEVKDRFGVLPNFFCLAPESPEITANLWGFAKFGYLDNPLPSLFKERLFVYLSRFCEVRYCLARHVGFLVGSNGSRPAGDANCLPQTIEQAVRLIRKPFPRGDEIEPHIAVLQRIGRARENLLSSDSPQEDSVLACAAHVFLQTANAPRCLSALQTAFGEVQSQHLRIFLAFVRTAHYWTAVHAELGFEDDIKRLLATQEALAECVLNTAEARSCHASHPLLHELDTLRRHHARHQELENASATLRASEERYRRIFQAAAISIWDQDCSALKAALDELRAQGIADLDRYLDENPDFLNRAIHMIRINDVNDAVVRLFEATDKAELLSSLDRIFVPGTSDALREELLAIFEGKHYCEGEAPVRTLKGRPLVVAFSMSAAPDDPQLRNVLVSVMDITERKQAEEKAKLLAREVNHRSNNLLTLMGAMMRQTRADTVPEFISSMQARISALARVQTRLARDEWDRTELRKLIDEELSPFGKDIGGRFQIAGRNLPLGPDAAQALAITIHELAMNAAKYGALSVPVGRVAIEWAISGDRLSLTWTETDGPAVEAPSREGFGTRAISALSRQLGGTVSTAWRREGLVCTLILPAQALGNRNRR